MSETTLALIEEHMDAAADYETVNAIAKGTGLAYQTVYRYLQYLVRIGKAEVVNNYGKIGRPKQVYRKIR